MDHVFDHSEESTSTGCESGWTLYLQHSIPHDNYNVLDHQQDDEKDYDDDDDDDMSMVSDASSGPPHFHDEDEYCNMNNNDINNVDDNDVFCDPTLVSIGSRKRRKILNKQNSFHSHRHMQDDLAVSLDDTASSPFFNLYNKDLIVCNKEASMLDDDSSDYSQGHSTTYFEMV